MSEPFLARVRAFWALIEGIRVLPTARESGFRPLRAHLRLQSRAAQVDVDRRQGGERAAHVLREPAIAYLREVQLPVGHG